MVIYMLAEGKIRGRNDVVSLLYLAHEVYRIGARHGLEPGTISPSDDELKAGEQATDVMKHLGLPPSGYVQEVRDELADAERFAREQAILDAYQQVHERSTTGSDCQDVLKAVLPRAGSLEEVDHSALLTEIVQGKRGQKLLKEVLEEIGEPRTEGGPPVLTKDEIKAILRAVGSELEQEDAEPDEKTDLEDPCSADSTQAHPSGWLEVLEHFGLKSRLVECFGSRLESQLGPIAREICGRPERANVVLHHLGGLTFQETACELRQAIERVYSERRGRKRHCCNHCCPQPHRHECDESSARAGSNADNRRGEAHDCEDNTHHCDEHGKVDCLGREERLSEEELVSELTKHVKDKFELEPQPEDFLGPGWVSLIRDSYRKYIPTPRGSEDRPTVAVFGAGIAGMTAAHELSERGFVVTVYEPRRDERASKKLVGFFPGFEVPVPPVKLGGLAASQYTSGEPGEHVRPFKPSYGGHVPRRIAERELPGEHGFRFFPAYYMHIWDMLQRIPIYEPRVVPVEIGGETISPIVDVDVSGIADALGYSESQTATLARARADVKWVATSRSVYDNVNRIVTQASTTGDGQPTLIFPREAPHSLSELMGALSQIRQLGFAQSDIQTFSSRLIRYLVTSPLRRSMELESVSAYEFFVGRDPETGKDRFHYTKAFDDYLRDLPKVLAAFDAEWGDARTNVDTLLQLQLRMDRRDTKADGVLNGPTTDAWFDHWYHHLSRMGVTFEEAGLKCLVRDGDDSVEAFVEEWDEETRTGRQRHLPVRADYIVVATDAYTAEHVTESLREAKIAGGVQELLGFASSRAPERPPRKDKGPLARSRLGELRDMPLKKLRKERVRKWMDEEGGKNVKKEVKEDAYEDALDKGYSEEKARHFAKKAWRERKRAQQRQYESFTRFELIEQLRDGWQSRCPPAKRRGVFTHPIEDVGTEKWDRFQNLTGIQFFFDTEFQLVRGHVYYSGSDWALSSINQAGLWEDKPLLIEDGYVSVLSVDIGDWNTPAQNLKSESHPHGKTARECTVDELAEEVWHQIASALSNDRDRGSIQTFPEPVCYALDSYLTVGEGDRVVCNAAPYLVPIVDDWRNRPGGYPWNPHGSSTSYVRSKEESKIHRSRGVWMADHGGYEVYNETLVFAGTWKKTFTRMTTMEAACESGRHAVNAILDHWIQRRLEERDRQRNLRGMEHDNRAAATVGLGWRWPFGFVDQGGSLPVRQPTPAGDYCFIFDIENREIGDLRPTRVVDERLADHGLPHPWEAPGFESAASALSQTGYPFDATMPTDPFSPEYIRWSLQHFKNWRRLFQAMKEITEPDKTGGIDLSGMKKASTSPPGWEAIPPSRLEEDTSITDYA